VPRDGELVAWVYPSRTALEQSHLDREFGCSAPQTSSLRRLTYHAVRGLSGKVIHADFKAIAANSGNRYQFIFQQK
jgi:hypothetical protein